MTDNSPVVVGTAVDHHAPRFGVCACAVSFEVIMDWPCDQLVNELTNLLSKARPISIRRSG